VTIEEAFWARMDRIVSIDLSIDPEHAAAADDDDRQINATSIRYIFIIFPGLQTIDMSGLKIGDVGRLFSVVGVSCPHVRRLTWNNSRTDMMRCGLGMDCDSNMTLVLDNICFQSPFSSADTTIAAFGHNIGRLHRLRRIHLMQNCSGLERLSIKNATWCLQQNPAEVFPISQEMLIKMVRNHRTLRWLRSDLSAENVALLKQDRPHFTFVSN
jgi:hypothetical protein